MDVSDVPNQLNGRRATSPAPRTAAVLYVDRFPVRSETFIVNETLALPATGLDVRVEARVRPAEHERFPLQAQVSVDYWEDERTGERLRAMLWLAGRHPLRCLADVLARRRWARQEPVWPLRALAPAARRLARRRERHLHAHFAAGAALDAMRISRVTGVPYSVATHGYDIFARPSNLVEKHAAAAFAVTASEYSASHLRSLVGPPHDARIQRIIVGVDTDSFRRAAPSRDGRRVLAVARLVEKKGLSDLIAAAATCSLDSLTIAGAGPLRGSLTELVHRLNLDSVVHLVGWQTPVQVRMLLEDANVLAMPCVVAGDGDRDTMPLAIKEALSMEVPVVASQTGGLPELVRPEFGRLVPPGDVTALAAALDEILSLPLSRRVEMGRAGRAWVVRHCSLDGQATRLAELISASSREQISAPTSIS